MQNLPLVRFRFGAWLCRANVSGPVSAVGAHIVRPTNLPLGRLTPFLKGKWPKAKGGRDDVERSETEGIGICPSRRISEIYPLTGGTV